MLWQLVLSLKSEIRELREAMTSSGNSTTLRGAEFSEVTPVTSLIKYSDSDLLGVTPPATSLEDAEKNTIADTLARNNGNKRKTAEDLNISLRTLYRKIQDYGL